MKSRLIIGILLAVGAIASLVKALDVHKDFGACAEWLYTEGKVVRAELSPSASANRYGGVNYSPEIQYTYTVNSREYTSDVIIFGGVMAGRFSKMYKRYIERYPENSTVKVYYDPVKPENAVLKPYETKGFTKYYLLASFLAICGSLIIINFFTDFGEGIVGVFLSDED